MGSLQGKPAAYFDQTRRSHATMCRSNGWMRGSPEKRKNSQRAISRDTGNRPTMYADTATDVPASHETGWWGSVRGSMARADRILRVAMVSDPNSVPLYHHSRIACCLAATAA